MADFVLGRLKFKWRGDWAVSTAYLIDDIAKYGGNTYVAITNHTSQSSSAGFYTDLSASKWQLHSEGLFFKGNWAFNTHYKLNDVVKYGGRQQRCTTQHTSASSGGLETAKFELYTDGLDFKGDWAGSTFYKLNDIVKFGAYQYKTTTEHTSHATNFDSTKFAVYSEGLQFEDSYSSSTTYQDGDVVTYGGYTYVYINSSAASGQTPTDNSYWDIITTGYNNTGTYSHGTAYKTGDVVRYGGNSYTAKTNNTSEYPAVQASGATNTTHWELVVAGFQYVSGGYNGSTTYLIGQVIRHSSTSYVMLKDRQVNVTPGSDATVWEVVAQGDTGAVTTTRGDLIKQGASSAERLAIGVSGAVLTTDGTDPIWSNAEGKNVIYVANSGSDTNPGSQYLPFKTVNKALSVASSGDIVEIDTIAGGTGGTPGVYNVTTGITGGSGGSANFRVTTDGSSTPTVLITDGGNSYVAGETITIAGAQTGSSSNITFNVTSASVGDVVYIKNGVYRENLPLRIPAGVTVQGESLRGTEIRPATSTGSQIKTVSITTNVSGATNGTYNYVHSNATTGSGTAASAVFNVTVSGGAASAVTVYNGGVGFAVNDQVTIPAASVGNGGNLVLTISALENNNASNMFLLNNTTNLVQMSMKGLTGTPGAGGTSKAAVTSLDPSGSISTTSPYIQNCSSVNAGATGVQIDGNLHSAGNKSILGNDFTQINSDGIGVHALAGGRGEMVSIFTYYCDKSFYAHSGGFIRGLNCSSAYGEKGAVAEGTLASETAVSVAGRGEMLKYATAGFISAATESDVSDAITTSGTPTAATIVGVTSGASATLIRVNISLDHLHITGRSGNFTQGEVCTVTKDDSSTFQLTLDAAHGDSTAAQTGQIGPLIAVDGSALSSATAITVGSNVQFAGDSTYYRISAVSETNTSAETALIRLTASVTSGNAIADNTVGTITTKYSNVRLTGHDFLDIGTGDIATSNYPGGPSQAAAQEDEVDEVTGGRVYFSSTDQKGDFRVGDLFRIEQATGIATLSADAFDLSGLSELQLGSIGAELGATINEFSTDETLSNDSNTAIPTEKAIVGYTQRDQMGTGHLVPPTGTTAERPTGSALKTGGVRYNSSLVTWEGYNGTQWTGLGGGNPWASTSTNITIAANDRYFVDTSGAAKTITLPASPQVGDQVSLLDLAGTFDTNNLTIGRNSLKIMGQTADMTIAVEDAAVQLVYTGATYGWKLTQNN